MYDSLYSLFIGYKSTKHGYHGNHVILFQSFDI